VDESRLGGRRRTGAVRGSRRSVLYAAIIPGILLRALGGAEISVQRGQL
jgi:hypothetical protein